MLITHLINLYNTSVTHKACIDFSTNAIVGDGIDWDAMDIKNVQTTSGTFTKAASASWSRGQNGIPNNWTVVDYSE